MIFPVAMCGCENWTIMKPKCRRIDVFEVWCWKKLLRVPWTARRSNQLTLNELNPESLEELLLKLQSFGHLLQRANWLEKILILGKIEGKRRGWQKMRWIDNITDSVQVNLSKLQEIAKGREAGMLQSMGSQRVRHDLVAEKQHEHWHQRYRHCASWLFQEF